MKKTKPFIWVTFFFTFFLTQVTLEAQEPVILDSKMKPGISNDMRIEELKVRWKKAALENCPGVPCVTTAVPGAPTAVVATAGNASASISFVAPTNNGGSTITSYTVTSNPGGITGTGSGSPITVTGLTNGTSYTFTVVAINAAGSSVASTASSSVTPAAPPPITACGSITNISDHQGNSYPTVSIGNQCWMASNLRVTTYNDGNATVIPDETANSDANWGTLSTGALTSYPGNAAYVATYGYLYNWHAITDSRKICPNGWHIPTDAEWNTLANFLDPLTLPVSVNNGYESLVAGGMMKSTDALWINNTGANNTSGFSALPGGFRKDNGSFLIGQGAYFWSSTPHSTNNAWYRQLESGFTRLGRFMNQGFTFNKSAGASVRCLKD